MSTTADGCKWDGNAIVNAGIKREIGDALEEAEREREGTERYMARDIRFSVMTVMDRLPLEFCGLTVTYLPDGSRAPREEELEWIDGGLEGVLARVREELDTEDGKTTVLALATDHPTLYWWLYYQHLTDPDNRDVEEILKDADLLQTKRRRRKVVRN